MTTFNITYGTDYMYPQVYYDPKINSYIDIKHEPTGNYFFVPARPGVSNWYIYIETVVNYYKGLKLLSSMPTSFLPNFAVQITKEEYDEINNYMSDWKNSSTEVQPLWQVVVR